MILNFFSFPRWTGMKWQSRQWRIMIHFSSLFCNWTEWIKIMLELKLNENQLKKNHYFFKNNEWIFFNMKAHIDSSVLGVQKADKFVDSWTSSAIFKIGNNFRLAEPYLIFQSVFLKSLWCFPLRTLFLIKILFLVHFWLNKDISI